MSRQGITRLTQGVCLVNPDVTRGAGASAGCVRSGSFSEPQHLHTNRVNSQCSCHLEKCSEDGPFPLL